ncbi:hypothetical protein [Marinobacter sp. SS8-8]|uniref:hypothetical protein n=1 Tax=Marinobacter sp. SS8-8 TaxID=3050452 RepID=UPI0026DF6100|nr:hypothetical protein [Marinobacter sp. SS8-8]
MSGSRKLVVVGGLPEPIGGVTNFLLRLTASGQIHSIVDIYPNKNKLVPKDFDGKIWFLRSKLRLVLKFFGLSSWFSGNDVFFNFSKSRSLIFFLVLPKRRSRFFLMLHHGDLSSGKFRWIYRFAISRIDRVYCISEKQYDFYIGIGVAERNIIKCKSYLPPRNQLSFCLDQRLQKIDNFFQGKRVIVCSGYPSPLYNHKWCINFVKEHPDWSLAVFLYGDGNDFDDILRLSDALPNVLCFYNFNQFEFNYALAKAAVYFRPTVEDSFGVAVADAVTLGIPALASNICERYPGTYLFSPSDYRSFERDALNFLRGKGVRACGDTRNFQFSFEINAKGKK